MPYRPQLSRASAVLTREVPVLDERGHASVLTIPAERPLTLYLDRRELVTVMTLGSAPEMLALGYLRNQGLVKALEQVAAVQVDWDVNAVAITTRDGKGGGPAAPASFDGLMDNIERIVLPADARLPQSTLYRIIDTVRNQQSVYRQAGSVHGCALFSSDGDLLSFVEDVGRHNAVDAIAGQMWLDGVDGGDKVFYTTGRLTSEMVFKGAQMGIPFLLSRSGTTQMGHAVARKLGMTLLSRCSGRHFLVLAGAQRLVFEPGSAVVAR
ncbi:formate dehydrogenase accessory sulfurtransferase FdhD [Pseudoduganella buxea]|uniref:Protein FdhD n=1 Tax=Pseudoduganella buxea TaxID=1949069 RepID=A0A6I3SUK5_9BURK|nr:formate dehydrogenase accessory sulfurtransferase FdhD [Pseudoduganella buxea]MTV52729.1 sulfurtransferase FdhD [Pseudoduganella buxea]GGC18610.1 sulfurtransferase FdhD [Pseudoduganella buxea]